MAPPPRTPRDDHQGNGNGASKSSQPRTWGPGAVVVVLLTAAYDVAGIIFIARDSDVAAACHPSNAKAHVIWSTSLVTYVVASLLVTTGMAVATGLCVPVRKAIRDARLHMQGVVLASASGPKSSVNLPDMLLLVVGAAYVASAVVIGIFAFWGYFELFHTRMWCDDKKTAFEELDLWKFGQASWVGQVIICCMLLLFGFFMLSGPFMMELASPRPEALPISRVP